MKNWKLGLCMAALFALLSLEKMAAQNKNGSEFDDYGAKLGIGISILDGFGVPVRYYHTPRTVFDFGIFAGGVTELFENNQGDLEFLSHGGLETGLGASFFGNKFEKQKRRKTKIRSHGVALRANYLAGAYSTFKPKIGWAMETFRKDRTQRSFIFELGLQGLIPVNSPLDPTAGLYLRCHWNFFIR